MKSTLLLATGLFLISAPTPDAQVIAELTANFIVPKHVAGTLASDAQLERGAILVYPADTAGAVASIHIYDAEQERPEAGPAG